MVCCRGTLPHLVGGVHGDGHVSVLLAVESYQLLEVHVVHGWMEGGENRWGIDGAEVMHVVHRPECTAVGGGVLWRPPPSALWVLPSPHQSRRG